MDALRNVANFLTICLTRGDEESLAAGLIFAQLCAPSGKIAPGLVQNVALNGIPWAVTLAAHISIYGAEGRFALALLDKLG